MPDHLTTMTDRLPKTSIDVAIIGGGIAGASMGAVLARSGFGVLIVERDAEFRDKVKGEGIHPWGHREARRLNLIDPLVAAGIVELPIWQTYTNRIADEPTIWTNDEINPLPELTVFHPDLQNALLQFAENQGANIIRPAKAIALRGGRRPELDVVFRDQVHTISARLVIGADGRTTQTRKWIGAETVSDPVHHIFGGARLANTKLTAGMTHGATVSGSRMFTFPQRNGFARAYLFGQIALMKQYQGSANRTAFVRRCASLVPAGMLDNAEPIGPIAFFNNCDIWSSKLTDEGIVLIGDAAGANDPSAGQGLSLVFRDVRVLHDLLVNEKDWNRAIQLFALNRTAHFTILRDFAHWLALLTIDTGREADIRREQVGRAREQDPSAGGFSTIFSRGPEGLVAGEAARRHFFGEDF